MRYLTVIRHAKAEDAAAWADDFARPLTDRGQRDARAVARLVESLEPPVDWWVTSPAVRALETAQVIHREGARSHSNEGRSGALHQEASLYLASPEALLAVVRQVPPSQQHLAMVGHNPGLEALVAALCTSGSVGLNFRMPTATMAHLELAVAHWEQVRWGSGELRLLVTPKAAKK
jgi:phosphohistidine phosphatase